MVLSGKIAQINRGVLLPEAFQVDGINSWYDHLIETVAAVVVNVVVVLFEEQRRSTTLVDWNLHVGQPLYTGIYA